MVQGQIDVNDPSSRDVAFGALFFLSLNHWSALAKLRGTSAIKPYLTLEINISVLPNPIKVLFVKLHPLTLRKISDESHYILTLQTDTKQHVVSYLIEPLWYQLSLWCID